ncbi:MAG TPA: hypothetical protein VGJ51_00985 [Candidatus Angelobacter sp.]
MFKQTLRPAWIFLCLASLLLLITLPALAQQTAGNSTQALPVAPARPRLHIVPVLDPNNPNAAAIAPAAPAGAHLSYFGGPVISNVHVVQVLYGSGSYNAQVAGTTSPTMGNFYGDLTGANSGYTSLLTQYNTPVSGGTNQTIGNGTFDGLFQIVPSAGNNGSTISDAQIQSELLAQITAGHLPAPILDAAGNVNTLYMIFFPPGKTITQGGSSSCVAGGFCAYHGTTSTLLNGKNVLYGVMPDMQSGLCSTGGCGNGGVFGNYTSVTSHELTEAITDADVGIATAFAPPLAWYDMVNGEIGDICNGQQGSYVANGTTYTIQLEFSNAANNCVLPPAAPTPNFSIAATPASQTVTAGAGTSYTTTVAASGGFTGVVGFTISGLPTGASASFNPTSVTGSGSSTLSVSTSTTTPAGTYTLTVTGTDGVLTHTASATLVVTTPDFSLTATPSVQTIVSGDTAHYTATVGALNGYTGTVTFSVSGLPAGASPVFTPGSVTSSGSSALAIATTIGTPNGSYPLVISATDGVLTHSANVTLVVTDFGISATPSTQTIVQGNSASYSVALTVNSGFLGTVNFSVTGLPASSSAAFNPASLSASGTTTLTVTTSGNTPAGTYSLTIAANDGSITRTASVALLVDPGGDFGLAISPSSQTVDQGQNAGYGVTVSASGGFTALVNLSVSGVPTGATATLSPSSVQGSGLVSLAIVPGANTPGGTYTITVTGSSGPLVHTVTATLIILVPPPGDFTISAPPTITVKRNATGTEVVTISAVDGFNGVVNLSASNLPSLVTASFTPASVTSSGTSTLKFTVDHRAIQGVYQVTITGTSGSLLHSTTVMLTVN